MAATTARGRALALLIGCAVACLTVGPAEANWQQHDFEDQGGTYAWIFLPTSPATGLGPLPVVIFFHGSGSNPEDWLDFLGQAAAESPVAIIAPKSEEFLTFHSGVDDVTVEQALELLLNGSVPIDRSRISLAGHSAGGGHAMVMAYGRRMGINAVFTLASPYRTVLDVADPDVTPPIRMYYGTNDPNYEASRVALENQWDRLGVPWELDVGVGFSHGDWPDGTLEAGFEFLKNHPYATAGGCVPTNTTLCLQDGTYAVTATWTDFDGQSGDAQVATARTRESGLLTFFSDTNWELQVKVLDACTFNGHRWVFAAGTTNVGFVLRVEEMATGEVATYENPRGMPTEPILDTSAFVCE